jgi:hypothetical protein
MKRIAAAIVAGGTTFLFAASRTLAQSTPAPTASTTNGLIDKFSPQIVSVLLIAAAVAVALAFMRPRVGFIAANRALSDKELEGLRIVYGFWLIIGGFLLVLAVAVMCIVQWDAVSGKSLQTSDIIAVITSITTVVGTLTAAFFGIQAASGGRSQAMDKVASQASPVPAPPPPQPTPSQAPSSPPA